MSKQKQTWKIIDIINWGNNKFSNFGILNARSEIEWMLCHILNYKRIDLYIHFDEILNNDSLTALKKFIKRRLAGEPFQHIIGKSDYYGRDFIVNKNVLIPRPETEIIIDILKLNNIHSMLEIGTGSGCIAITASIEKIAKNIIATDISEKAIYVAKQNMKIYNANNINFIIHDFLSDTFNSKFDVIVSNPPYIAKTEMKKLQNEVINFDPHIALTDFADGLSFYKRFANQLNNLLNENGRLILEIGGNHQKQNILDIFSKYTKKIHFHKDLQGDIRVVEVIK